MKQEVVRVKVENPYTMLLDEETRTVLKARKIREQMVDAFIVEKGIPTKTNEMRVVNEILNSMDSQTFGLVDRRFKAEDSKQLEDVTELIKEIFTKQQTIPVRTNDKDVILEDKFLPDDMVLDEDSVDYKELSMEDIIGG